MKEKKSNNLKVIIANLLRGKKPSKRDLDAINVWYYTQQADEAELKKALRSIDREVVLRSIHKKSRIYKDRVSRSRFLYFSAAAGLFLVFLIGSLFYSMLQKTEENMFEISMTEVLTKQGERKKGELPDGSIVYLKENSSIRFQEDFQEGRLIYLSGEAFFQVKKSESEPFRVIGNFLETTVLGTEFLVSEKRNSTEMVIVKSGKVSVAKLKVESDPVILDKGQRASLSIKDQKLKVSSVENDEKYFAWTEGTLVLERANASRIAKELSTWFGIEVINGATDTDCIVSGAYNKMDLLQILETINYSVNLKYEYDGKKLIIKSMSCK